MQPASQSPAQDPATPTFLLTAVQTTVWLAQQLATDPALYNIGGYIEVAGTLDHRLFEAAVRRAVLESDVHRLRFAATADGPVQSSAPLSDFEIPALDLTRENEPQARAMDWMRSDLSRPFDFSTPLFRCALLTVSPDRTLCYFGHHHLITDVLGFGLFANRIAELYAAAVRDEMPPANRFLAWRAVVEDEAAYLSSAQYQNDRAFWHTLLSDRPDVVTLCGRAPVAPQGTVSHVVQIEAATLGRLRALARTRQTGLVSVIYAVLALYLYRISGQRDLLFGFMVSGRSSPTLKQTAGVVSNVIPLRLSVDPDKSFGDLVAQTGSRIGEALEHQRYPFSELQADLKLPANEPDIWGTLLNFLPAHPIGDFGSSRATFNFIPHTPRVEDFWLTAQERADGSGLLIQADGNAALYDEQSVKTHLRGLVAALNLACSQADVSLRTIDLLNAADRQVLLGQFCGRDWKAECRSLVELFEEQVLRSPEAIAACLDERSLSYGELNWRANAVAHQLIGLGVGPERIVGVWADRTLEMLIGLLGVHKAGGAYLPLDPNYPPDRLTMMLTDAKPMLLLSSAASAAIARDSLPGCPQQLEVDLSPALSAEPANPRITRELDDPAYIIYTSGSTGRPKGVIVTHRGMSALAGTQTENFKLTSQSRVLQVASLNFDVSVGELLMAWANGATLVLAHVESLGGDRLRSLLIDQRITHTVLGPSVLATMKRTAEVPLQCLAVAGEALPPELATQWSTGLRMINAYGPTESTVYATMTDALVPGRGVTIGSPMPGTHAYVLDAALEPVPRGAAGELYISGVGLARGYLNRPSLTAERFVANPYGAPGSRMYRTGDLARWTDAGELEYLGRVDQQVKLRGMRIELGEIESALREQPGIEHAVVTVRDDAGTGKYLAAYLVCRKGQRLAVSELRTALGKRLARYMIPSVFVELQALPINNSGKLDRRALPAPARMDQADSVAELPRTPTERQLAAIWADVLRVSDIGRADDFFGRGGNSLLAIQVVARIRDIFRLELPLKALFDAPTLDALGSRLEQLRQDGQASSLAPIEARTWDGPAPLSYSQERMWLIQALNANSTAYNITVSLWLDGLVEPQALSDSYDELLKRHEILRSRVVLVEDRPHQVVQPFQPASLQVIDLRDEPDAKARALELAGTEARTVFDLTGDPVIRASLMRTGETSSLLLFVLHHIAGDQWSIGILARELATAYNQRRAGSMIKLDPLPISYRDFAHWQRHGAGAVQLGQQLAFWRQQLANLPTVDIPVDLARPKVWTTRGALLQRPIPAALFDAISGLARRSGSTPFMTLLAGFAVLLHRIGGQKDLPIGVPVANRALRSLEGLVGTFVNTVVIRNDLGGDPSFSELLKRVRRTSLEAFANQDVSFDRLVQELGQRTDRSRAPLTQVLFNVPNAPMHGIEFDELTWEDVTLDRGGAQFELSFTVDTEVTCSLFVEYNTDLFLPATVERLIGQYFTLLTAAAASPQTRISRLSLLPPHDLAALHDWNATRSQLPSQAAFPQMFEAQVARTPQACAVTFEGAHLSYDELNSRANGLAHVLQAAGANRGERIAVCVKRSLDMLVCLLASQKSGATYVPLDPDFPAQRLQYMLTDSAARVLLVSGALPRGFEVPEDIAVIDCTAGHAATGDVHNLASKPLPSDAAYILYTSGSTGRPKGVAVSHGALANFLWSMQATPGMSDKDVVAAVTTISFDIAGLELYLPLMSGARIELIPRQVATDGQALAERLDNSGATLLQATPATWRMLLEAGWTGNKRLRALCGGEALPRSLANEILARTAELWNMYGPTETTVWSTLDKVAAGTGAISIGQPIANTQVHILDASGELAPLGVAGEICIGGAGVAEGYFGRPALTAERFVADAYSAAPGARLYRTGDLGRWGTDGKLYHLGRTDHQVKIRGFRIELGEIEQALESHSAVSRAVVVVREARADDPRLVAYVVYGEDQEVTVSEMKRHLRGLLPDYMVPSMIMALLSMPLTPNGKADRSALPDPFTTQSREPEAEQPAATATEQVLIDIWRSVLKIDRIEPRDNFFELGGYSLLSLRVVKLVEKQTGRPMDPRSLFFHSLREIAESLR